MVGWKEKSTTDPVHFWKGSPRKNFFLNGWPGKTVASFNRKCIFQRSIRGHYITNPNNAPLRGNSPNLPYICIVWFPAKWVINDPCPFYGWDLFTHAGCSMGLMKWIVSLNRWQAAPPDPNKNCGPFKPIPNPQGRGFQNPMYQAGLRCFGLLFFVESAERDTLPGETCYGNTLGQCFLLPQWHLPRFAISESIKQKKELSGTLPLANQSELVKFWFTVFFPSPLWPAIGPHSQIVSGHSITAWLITANKQLWKYPGGTGTGFIFPLWPFFYRRYLHWTMCVLIQTSHPLHHLNPRWWWYPLKEIHIMLDPMSKIHLQRKHVYERAFAHGQLQPVLLVYQRVTKRKKTSWWPRCWGWKVDEDMEIGLQLVCKVGLWCRNEELITSKVI